MLYLLRLTQPFVNKERNVTTDHFFTSVALAQKLKSKGTSLVGTMNRVRKEVPPFAKKNRHQNYDTTVLKRENCTLTIYQCKKNKNVLLLRSIHPIVKIDSTIKNL